LSILASGAVGQEVDWFAENKQLDAGKSRQFLKFGKNGQHEFGLAVMENKQFHYSKTDEDGVRLGLFGYELNGKKHILRYIADKHGFRNIPLDVPVLAYPPDGSPPR